jgi:hypothetical protein
MPSNALLGRLFHELFSSLTGADKALNLIAPLELADASSEDWTRSLIDHAFTAVISPALAEHEAVLRTSGAEVLAFWTAARDLCRWLVDLMLAQRSLDPEQSLARLRHDLFAESELELAIELSDADWPDSIQLVGRADALLRRPGDAGRCVVELKLGRTFPEADLLQGCLYHLMLEELDPAAVGAALGIVCFEPERHERVFDAGQLVDAKRALKSLLAELAGFAPRVAAVTDADPDSGLDPRPTTGTTAASHVSPTEPASGLLDLRSRLQAAFTEYGAPLRFAEDTAIGPTFVRFFAAPERGVSAKRLPQLAENVWMRLRTSKRPQISLLRGRVAIDVERPDRQSVEFAAFRAQLPAPAALGSSRFAVGVGVDGTLQVADLAESQSPHLLVVGTTGSGKSEWLRAFLVSLLVANSPDSLRLVLIDPKRLAFSAFERSPFLWQPIVYDEGAIELFDALVGEMERRYELLQAAGTDDLTRYNEAQAAGARDAPGAGAGAGGAIASGLPRIVCVCDEFADLLLRDKQTRGEIEARVARLGVKGRAAGVHLVFATQRAGREILKGTIDSNLPARVALTVARDTDSRLILGEAGAENLLGRGDLLYKDIGAPVRLQGLHVTAEELFAAAAGAPGGADLTS